MATISPSPFPTDGARTLSPKESMQRMQAVNCTVSKDTKPKCSGQVYVGMFFDGTGNNMTDDFEIPPPEKRKHTNVVKLFHTYKDNPAQGYVRYYIPGVGTPFPEIGEKKAAALGGTAAAGGEQRIYWALLQLINAPYRYVFGDLLIKQDRLKTLSNEMLTDSTAHRISTRQIVLNEWQNTLKAKLKDQKPNVEQINLSVFGFSRGAAEARVFVNWLFSACKQEGGGWTFAGIPIRVDFLGILDTVASVGLANLLDDGVLAGHQSWADNTLQIHPAVEQCVHYVAGHEVRGCFPLDSVRIKNVYPGNAKEVMYPGAHSDVGGGYAPGALGIAAKPNSCMSVIVGTNMYKEALQAGVPLTPMNLLQKQFADALTPDPETIKDFNAYLRDANIGAGTVEEMHKKHMSHYHSYRFKHRAHFQSVGPWKAASSVNNIRDGKRIESDAEALRMTQANFIESLSLDVVRPGDPSWTPMQAVQRHKQVNAIFAQPGKFSSVYTRVYEISKNMHVDALTPAIEKFCGEYIHDSLAGFILFGMHEYGFNQLGLAKYRFIFKGDD